MDKEEIQQRVLREGKPLDTNRFCWDEKTTTFSSAEDNLVIDFSGIDYATIKCGNYATINCRDSATIKCWESAAINCGYNAAINCCNSATIDCGNSATIKCWDSATINCGNYASIDCWSSATINCGDSATIDCWDYATIKCGNSATIKCENSASIKCCDYATIKCENSASIKCWDSATIDCGDSVTIACGDENVIVRRGIFQVIQPTKGGIIQIAPYQVKGYIQDGIYSETGRPAIIADRILSEVISKKEKNGTVIYRVINHKETAKSYLLEIDGVYSHGKTIKEAKESYKYKISNRDTSEFKHLTLESVITDVEAIKLYRTVTGACESGTRYFVENLENAPKKLTVEDLIKLTKGQFNHDLLAKFINNNKLKGGE